jgi:hypothetical protein
MTMKKLYDFLQKQILYSDEDIMSLNIQSNFKRKIEKTLLEAIKSQYHHHYMI